jgi:mono/diheme cytochrome c family protein
VNEGLLRPRPRSPQGRLRRDRPVFHAVIALAVAGTHALAATRPPRVPASEADARVDSTGELLLSELNCTRCHEAPPAIAAWLHPKPAPWLGQAAGRLQPDFVRQWLRDPLGTLPGTTMPDVLGHLSERDHESAIEEVLHFLWSLMPTAPPTAAPASEFQIQQGRVLYHQTGCVACHPPFAPASSFVGDAGGAWSDTNRVRLALEALASVSQPFPDLAAKYLTPGLATFLRDPLAIRPGGRMPSLKLTDAESRAIAAYLQSVATVPRPAAPRPTNWVWKPDVARRGQERFAAVGCANCHELGPGRSPLARRRRAPGLASLDPDAPGGCLDSNPGSKAARYALSEVQRAALRTVLRDLPQLDRESAASERVAQALARFNCRACHSRDGQGGPDLARAEYFHSLSESDLGDEGRFPPHLNRVGEKLRPNWLGAVLTNGGAVRPYLAVRMPQFGAANVGSLASDFVAADSRTLVPEAAPAGDATIGAQLVGLRGYSCVNCHSFGPHPSLGISVMDLTRMAERLNWGWFRRYLEDPVALRPGTRMPSFWPEGKATVTSVLGGDTGPQIAAIWAYLSLGKEAPPPPGLLENLDHIRSSVTRDAE